MSKLPLAKVLFRPQNTKCPRLNIPEGSWGLCSPAWSDVTELERSWSATRLQVWSLGLRPFCVQFASSPPASVQVPIKGILFYTTLHFLFCFLTKLACDELLTGPVRMSTSSTTDTPWPWVQEKHAVIEKEGMDVRLVKSPHKAFWKGRRNIVSIMFMVRQEPGAPPSGNTVWVSRQVMARKSQ